MPAACNASLPARMILLHVFAMCVLENMHGLHLCSRWKAPAIPPTPRGNAQLNAREGLRLRLHCVARAFVCVAFCCSSGERARWKGNGGR